MRIYLSRFSENILLGLERQRSANKDSMWQIPWDWQEGKGCHVLMLYLFWAIV